MQQPVTTDVSGEREKKRKENEKKMRPGLHAPQWPSTGKESGR